jgi:hypothetical protein
LHILTQIDIPLSFYSLNKIKVASELLFLKCEIRLMKKIAIIIAMALASITLWAQSSTPLRLEIPAPNGSDPFNYVTAGENGICIFYPTVIETGKDSINWSMMMVDDQLKELWHKQVPLQEDATFLKSLTTKDAIYLLFHDTKQKKNANVIVYMIVPKFKIVTEHKSGIPEKAEVVDFEVSNSIAYIGYNNRKSQPGIIGFSLISGEKRNFNITAEKDALLLDVAIDTARQAVFATYKIQYSSARNHLLVNKYNSVGTLVSNYDFTDQVERRNYNTAQYIPTGDSQGMVAGTYGFNVTSTRKQYNYYDSYYNNYYYNNSYNPYYSRQSEYDANEDNTPVSDGYYTGVVKNGIAGSMKYYNFSGFSKSYKYITNSVALRTKAKATKKDTGDDYTAKADTSITNAVGLRLKDKIARSNPNPTGNTQPDKSSDKDRTLNLRLIAHDIVMNNGELIISSEAYSPEYHTNTQMTYDYYGRAFPTSYQIFDGFRYSHAFIAGFDSSGNMVWNNGMEMRDILTKYLNRKLNCLFEDDEIVLYYNANNKIAVKTIQGNTIIDHTSYMALTQKRGADQHLDEYLGTIEHWYGNYFIATGYQTIRNNNLENNKRHIFYLSKLAFE